MYLYSCCSTIYTVTGLPEVYITGGGGGDMKPPKWDKYSDFLND